jgi:hypothetical protein
MFALLANGPAIMPTGGASPGEWAIWGTCMSIAALLGGWALWNMNRPERDTPVGVACLLAFVLVCFASFYSTHKHFQRMWEESRREQEQREQELEQQDREYRERIAPSR